MNSTILLAISVIGFVFLAFSGCSCENVEDSQDVAGSESEIMSRQDTCGTPDAEFLVPMSDEEIEEVLVSINDLWDKVITRARNEKLRDAILSESEQAKMIEYSRRLMKAYRAVENLPQRRKELMKQVYQSNVLYFCWGRVDRHIPYSGQAPAARFPCPLQTHKVSVSEEFICDFLKYIVYDKEKRFFDALGRLCRMFPDSAVFVLIDVICSNGFNQAQVGDAVAFTSWMGAYRNMACVLPVLEAKRREFQAAPNSKNKVHDIDVASAIIRRDFTFFAERYVSGDIDEDAATWYLRCFETKSALANVKAHIRQHPDSERAKKLLALIGKRDPNYKPSAERIFP